MRYEMIIFFMMVLVFGVFLSIEYELSYISILDISLDSSVVFEYNVLIRRYYEKKNEE